MLTPHLIFDYIDGEFVVETSGGQHHPRASLEELEIIFRSHPNSSISVKDQPAHYYEAQLLHYGLPVSKNKGIAAMRLLDELNEGTLKVPQNILRVEEILEREWNGEDGEVGVDDEDDDDKDAKGESCREKYLSAQSENQQSPQSSGPNHLQLNLDNLDFDFNRMSLKEKEREGSIAKGTPSKQEVLLFGGSFSQASSAQTVLPSTPSKQTYSRSSASPSGTTIKTEPDTGKHMERLTTPPTPSPGHVPLGLINGMYSISCSNIKEQRGSAQLNIILCLNTPQVWGAYDFGRYFGIFLLEQRPYRATDETLPVYWRGREYGIGTMAPTENDVSWISFLGNGEIEGCLDLDGSIGFWGTRIESPGTSSPRSAWSMKEEWNSYAAGSRAWHRS
jgi:hypothetical protein